MFWFIRMLFVTALVCFALVALGVEKLPAAGGNGVRLLPLGLLTWAAAAFCAIL
jgi:tellurite resistance protein TehA-like permease